MDVKLTNFVACPAGGGSQTSFGAVKLTDFGLSFRKGSIIQGPMGTIDHMAPELILACPDEPVEVVPDMDVWSFGMTLVELLASPRLHEIREPKVDSPLIEKIRETHVHNDQQNFLHKIEMMACIAVLPWERELIKSCLESNPRSRATVPELLVVVEHRIRMHPGKVQQQVCIGLVVIVPVHVHDGLYVWLLKCGSVCCARVLVPWHFSSL